MSNPPSEQPISPLTHPALIVLGYICIACLFLSPILLRNDLVGFLTVDLADTLYLRQEFIHHILGFKPIASYPTTPSVWPWLPNFVDHLSAVPFTKLPFPLSENLWWILCWSGGGLTAHYTARKLSASQAAAWLCGLSWMLSEASLREMNLFHAPQSMTLFMPLFVLALIRWNQTASQRDACFTGVLFAVNCLIYWYNGLFLGLILIPFILMHRHRSTLTFIITVAVICGLPLWELLSLDSPLMHHNGDPALNQKSTFWVADRSHRFSVVLLIAALIQFRSVTAGKIWLGLGIAAFILASGGPVWEGLQSVHFIIERLHWPVRWSILIPLVMLPLLAAQRCHSTVWMIAFLIETWVLSPNMPIAHTVLTPYQCLAQLNTTSGAILEAGYSHPRQRPWIALHQRIHQRPVVGPLAFPPGYQTSEEWQKWSKQNPWDDRFLGQASWPNAPFSDLQQDGISLVTLDKGLLSGLTEAQQNSMALHISNQLGPPQDLGCVWLWSTTVPPMNTEIRSYKPPKVIQRTEIERLDAIPKNQ